jgi:hypothetical protein
MRGSPPLHLSLFLIGFALIALPLVQLTSATPRTMPVAASTAPETQDVPVLLRLRFAHLPETVQLSHGDSVLFSGRPEAVQETTHVMALPAEGVEFSLRVQWRPGTPDTAVTLEVEPDALDAQAQTRWSSGLTLDEVIPFMWRN